MVIFHIHTVQDMWRTDAEIGHFYKANDPNMVWKVSFFALCYIPYVAE